MSVEINGRSPGGNTRTGIGAAFAVQDGAGIASHNLGLWIGVGTVAVGFLLGGCHVLLGAYPLGLALVCALRGGVWLALLGVVLGSLTLGKSGIIYGMIAVLAVFLRVVISGNDNKKGGERAEKGGLFQESVLLRTCSAIICGFVAAVYELLLTGLTLDGILFAVAMLLLPPLATFVISGVYLEKTDVAQLILGKSTLFSERAKNKTRRILFCASVLSIIVLLSLALSRYRLFGIDTSYIFASVITLFAAKRFGSLYGTVVGFCASFAVSGLVSPAFALLGAVAGAIFRFGSLYALLAGGAVVVVWGAYVGGVSGFLTIFPEYLISASLMLPAVRYLSREGTPAAEESVRRRATDMVGTMALAYRNDEATISENTEAALRAVAPIIKSFSGEASAYEDYLLFAGMLRDISARAGVQRRLNEELTAKAEDVFKGEGFPEGVIRVFGSTRPHVIMAGEDKDGVLITSPTLRTRLADALSVKLGTPEYFRRDEMVLMECSAAKSYKLHSATAKLSGDSGEISGDSVKIFEGADSYAYGVIADGMGSGSTAHEASEFAVEFLSSILRTGAGYTTAIHALNSVLRARGEECSVGVDVFSFDLVSAKACFIKSGAAPSYVKRADKLFRIKSQTVPLGVIKQVDAERISSDIAVGDVIVMISDGIASVAEECGWLTELLNKPITEPLADFARSIVEAAVDNGRGEDDMSVLVIEVAAA